MAKTKKFPRGKINKKWNWIVVANAAIMLFEKEPHMSAYVLQFDGDHKCFSRLSIASELILENEDLSNYYGLYQIED